MSTSGSSMRRVLLPEIAETATGGPLHAIALAPGEPAFYWRSDARDVEIAALGAVATVDAGGPSRFRDAAAALREIRGRMEDGAEDYPLAVGGFAFDDSPPAAPWEGFPALRLFVPRMLWVRRGGVLRMIVASGAHAQTPLSLLATGQERACAPRLVANGDGGERWRVRVDAAVRAIRDGSIEKIVLARRHTVASSGMSSADMAPLVRALAQTRPTCFTFLVRWSGRTFVGSSPERLLKLEAGTIEADALAGSAPRGLSKTHDDLLARELLHSAKECREHRIVADAIRESLAPFSGEIHAPDEPAVVRLPEAHHLHTPIRARLSAGASAGMLEIAERLHPTPAVCGAPRDSVCRQLAIEEPDRGWYGGAVGWIGSAGDGELAVALRAALLDQDCAHVWAGAGIVEGSSPEREYDETERKMRSILPYFERGRQPRGRDDECAA